MHTNILSTVGRTPLVKLERFFKVNPFNLFAKLESFNPGGSMKDRAALSILKNGMDLGYIRKDTTIIESSSGNMGIGLALACAYLEQRFICVVDPKTTGQNIKILKSYGAEIDLVSVPDPLTGEFLQARINRVQALCAEIPNSFWPNQYSNIYNARAHHQTMHEIVTELDGQVDYLFCATSTCGTLRGCADYIREYGLDTKIYAVDALGSMIFGSAPSRKRLIPGHGAAIRPHLYEDQLATRCIHMNDLECVVGCRRLVQKEAILAGGSSGAVLMAIDSVKDEIPPGSICAAILADRGERYLDTIYSDSWILEHFGDVFHLWENSLEEEEEEICIATTY